MSYNVHLLWFVARTHICMQAHTIYMWVEIKPAWSLYSCVPRYIVFIYTCHILNIIHSLSIHNEVYSVHCKHMHMYKHTCVLRVVYECTVYMYVYTHLCSHRYMHPCIHTPIPHVQSIMQNLSIMVVRTLLGSTPLMTGEDLHHLMWDSIV